MLLIMFGCEPGAEVTIKNDRNADVKLFVAHVRNDGSIDENSDYGTIRANDSKKLSISFLGDEWVNRLEIRDLNGKVLSSNDYTLPDLEELDWKISIE
jgi:hypothetical protein